MITPLQFETARRHPWLRPVYHRADIVENTLADPEIAGDPNTVPGPRDAESLDAPDALIGGHLAMDIVPDTQVSRRAHLDRGYINGPEQLIVYERPAEAFLAEIFR